MGDVRIGTSGFSYEDWKGHFYSEKIKKSDMLAYYATQFNTIEINSTYYAIPSPIVFSKMIEKTPDDFTFVVKMNQDITHSPEVNPLTVESYLKSIQPLINENRLGCILAQYPWNFKCIASNVARIRQLREMMGDLPVVIEFRNIEWISEKSFEFLRKHNLGFCCVDEPRLEGLVPDVAVATSQIGYMRFHGRNAAKWWKHDEAWERYDYRYTADEMQEWIPKIKGISEKTDKTFVFFNNHYKGQATDNAAEFKNMLQDALSR
jgi:uncharacterized protein YecE (DUF72 family)